jgi:hypothetical protein
MLEDCGVFFECEVIVYRVRTLSADHIYAKPNQVGIATVRSTDAN